ncbi:hypothetical protein [Methylobacillus sp.]|uniref:hypothetical protein n=1 Tax=Methylobacillus sp. TaxID=56818 RepID=UPI00257A7B40|nr:hypothetical protein [Methylobacillus sp.]
MDFPKILYLARIHEGAAKIGFGLKIKQNPPGKPSPAELDRLSHGRNGIGPEWTHGCHIHISIINPSHMSLPSHRTITGV